MSGLPVSAFRHRNPSRCQTFLAGYGIFNRSRAILIRAADMERRLVLTRTGYVDVLALGVVFVA